eukprot:CAMPEP_0172551220 /NCGR_PEP_ID=MMETSP1067-20121228/36750_1 /TAXON_ID=265564 ORGANISM="Thalassiosira punctigera, Strain Tpunct2005C2" /NCGR_SAMPLE_ID=MMETSP1067 /ASSEMBLY_ACC=CAM_ASM_000444 /LENGTH=78 /DNA_ID=CAMNT_0013338979 /DNA_START=170 /DNA_END=406 /DNA_ORIENTATION=+
MKLSVVSLVAILSSAGAFAPSASVVSRSATSSSLGVKTGSGGQPAKTKEEDLELTTQIILDYVNEQAAEDGIVDDDEE